MAEEVTQKTGRLVAAILAGLSLAFGSFAIGVPAALATKSDDPVTTEGTDQPTDVPTADETPNVDGQPSTDVTADSEATPEPGVPTESETVSEPVVDETSEPAPTLEPPNMQVLQVADDPTIHADVAKGVAGSAVTITGSGFEPSSPVELHLVPGEASVLANTVADAEGNIEVSATIPDGTEAGDYNIVANGNPEISTPFSVIEESEPMFTADREQIALSDFVGDPEDRDGVFFSIEGLEGGTWFDYIVEEPEGVPDLDGQHSIGANTTAGWWIAGPDTDDPSIYLGEYSVTISYEDGQEQLQTLGPVSFTVVEDETNGDDDGGDDEPDEQGRPEITLASDEVYPGESLRMEVSNLSPGGEVTVTWNPTETMTADASGNLAAELPIADDAEPGVYLLTVTDEEADESSSVEYTVLAFDDPVLTIDPETIRLEQFVGDPADGAGVAHVVENLELGDEISYVVSGPDGVNDYESTTQVNAEGRAEFVIHGVETSNNAVYLGDYTTVVTYEADAGGTAELSGDFTVITGDDDAVPAAAGTADVNGTSLATTGATGTQLGLLAGALLVAGGALLTYAHRGRLVARKH